MLGCVLVLLGVFYDLCVFVGERVGERVGEKVRKRKETGTEGFLRMVNGVLS
jgi:hypothetical protein